MSQENVEVVTRAIAAINARDIDGYLACCTEDVVLRTPMAEITGEYEGVDGIRRFLVDVRSSRRSSPSTLSDDRPVPFLKPVFVALLEPDDRGTCHEERDPCRSQRQGFVHFCREQSRANRRAQGQGRDVRSPGGRDGP